MTTLEQPTQQLYAAFADIPKPTFINGCPCCLDMKDIDILLASPLREISPRDMSSYASSAFLTVGDVGDYLYFLPRILEISASDDSWWPDPEITGRAIGATQPKSWQTSKLEAVSIFLRAVIRSAIEAGEYYKIDTWLCAIARMGLDVRPYLQEIAKCSEAAFAYFEHNESSLKQNRLGNAFWELPSIGHDVIVEWFHSEETLKLLSDKLDDK